MVDHYRQELGYNTGRRMKCTCTMYELCSNRHMITVMFGMFHMYMYGHSQTLIVVGWGRVDHKKIWSEDETNYVSAPSSQLSAIQQLVSFSDPPPRVWERDYTVV